MTKYLIIYLIFIHLLLYAIWGKWQDNKTELKSCLRKGIEYAEYIQELNNVRKSTNEKIKKLREIANKDTCDNTASCNCYNARIDTTIINELYKKN